MLRSLYGLAYRLSSVLVWLLEAASTLALMFIVFSFGWLVFGRYVQNVTPTWVEHVTLLLIAMVTFMMMAVNQRRGKNLAVGVVTDRIPPYLRRYVLAFVDVLVMVFGIVTAVYSVRLCFFNADQRIPILGISEGFRMIPPAIGGAILAYFSALNAIEHALGLEPFDDTEDDDMLEPSISSLELSKD